MSECGDGVGGHGIGTLEWIQLLTILCEGVFIRSTGNFDRFCHYYYALSSSMRLSFAAAHFASLLCAKRSQVQFC